MTQVPPWLFPTVCSRSCLFFRARLTCQTDADPFSPSPPPPSRARRDDGEFRNPTRPTNSQKRRRGQKLFPPLCYQDCYCVPPADGSKDKERTKMESFFFRRWWELQSRHTHTQGRHIFVAISPRVLFRGKRVRWEGGRGDLNSSDPEK